ncbi:MAG: hypothetical protein HY658_10605, partial [Actinobacteria bacterium]|nr:hypothetical protein [Actinomycetota bacterium]
TEWIQEAQAGFPAFLAMRRRAREHPIEEVGRELRAMMPWLPTVPDGEAPDA